MKYYGEKLHKHSQSGPFFCPFLHFLKYSCFPKKKSSCQFSAFTLPNFQTKQIKHIWTVTNENCVYTD